MKFQYSLRNIYPRINENNGFGFEVCLDLSYARKAKTTRLDEQIHNFLHDYGRQVAQNLGFTGLGYQPYDFDESSILVRIFVSPTGSRLLAKPSDLSDLMREKTENNLEYYTHNVAGSDDAFLLLSLFTKWVEILDTLDK